MGDYAGDSVEKKVARACVYRIARRAFSQMGGPDELDRVYLLGALEFEKAGKPLPDDDLPVEAIAQREGRRGGVVLLAGPEAHDVGPLSCTMPEVAANRVLFVDSDAACLAVARQRMPGAHVHHGPLHEVQLPWPVKLAVLDFCGAPEGPNWQGIAHVARAMQRHGSVMLVTQLRGREAVGDTARTVRWYKRQRERRGLSAQTAWPRAFALLRSLARTLGLPASVRTERMTHGIHALGPRIVLLGTVAYDGPVSPMLISALAFTCRELPGRYEQRRIRRGAGERTALLFADRMRGRMREAKDAHTAMLLDVTPSTLAAWRAHRTMGTYRDRPISDIL